MYIMHFNFIWNSLRVIFFIVFTCLFANSLNVVWTKYQNQDTYVSELEVNYPTLPLPSITVCPNKAFIEGPNDTMITFKMEDVFPNPTALLKEFNVTESPTGLFGLCHTLERLAPMEKGGGFVQLEVIKRIVTQF